MKSSIIKQSLESSFIQILRGIFKVKSTSSIKSTNEKSKEDKEKRVRLF